MRPILSMGNQDSKFLFWDLQRLEEGSDPAEEKAFKKGRKAKSGVSSENLNRLDGLKRGESVPSSDGTGGATRELNRFSTLLSLLTNRSYAFLDIQFGTSRTQICS